MEKNPIILDELREVSPALAEFDSDNVYSVPAGYFENLSQEIFSRINSDEEPQYNLPAVLPYKVKEGYFENLSENILSKIRASANHQNETIDELNEFAPLLNTLDKAPLYTLPVDYFENLQPVVGREKPGAKVITLSKKVRAYAAAAVITGLMAVGSYFIIDKELTPSKTPADNVNTAIKDLKDEEIINFLKTRTPENVTSTYSEKGMPAREIEQQLKEMTDEELQQYIKENGRPDEIEVDI
jgi:hypothetical protein